MVSEGGDVRASLHCVYCREGVRSRTSRAYHRRKQILPGPEQIRTCGRIRIALAVVQSPLGFGLINRSQVRDARVAVLEASVEHLAVTSSLDSREDVSAPQPA